MRMEQFHAGAVVIGPVVDPTSRLRFPARQPVGSEEMRTLGDVPMTSANRRAIREAAEARGKQGE